MYDIHNLELDPITAGWKAHKAAQDRAQGRESVATSEGRGTATAAQKTPENAPETAGEGYLFTLHVSEGREQNKNAIYKHKIQVKSWEDLRLAARYDHMASAMKNNYRKNENFIGCDCIMTDVDNTHSDDPDKWITADDIGEAFPVKYFSVRSRHYMKPKRVINKKTGEVTIQEPREKWHLYFPLSRPITNNAELENLLINLVSLFPFFDAAAIDPARMFYGVENPFVIQETGDGRIDEYINALDPEALRTAQRDALEDFTSHILDGSYKNNKGTRNTVKKICEFLKVPNPIPDPDEDAAPAQTADTAGGAPEWIQYADQERSEQWLLKWAQDHNVELGRRGTFSRSGERTIYYCVTCPWEEEHSMNGAENESVVLIEASGKLSYLCRHSHGSALNWKKYRDYYEAQAAPDQAQEGPQEPETLPGLLTLDAAIDTFKNANDKTLMLKSFPEFSKAAKIQEHDTVIIAADTGMGKSSLAINFMYELSEEYPCMYINLEMDNIDVLRRLVSIQSGIELNRVEAYKRDEKIAEAVNTALKEITGRKPIQVIRGSEHKAYLLENIEDIIKRSTAGREEPTMVFIDHSLLVDTKNGSSGRYDRFTQVSEGLRRIALNPDYKVILFILLQQSRAGKALDEERPRNSSLKESGSWENDSTQIVFLWWDPVAQKKKLVMTKNRHGEGGEFVLEYWKNTQTYLEAQEQTETAGSTAGDRPRKQTKRERQQEKLSRAYEDAYINTFGHPTLRAMAEAADVTTATIKGWLKEYGGCTIDGIQVDPAGIDTEVEYTGLVKITAADDAPKEFDLHNLELPEAKTPRAGRKR